MKKYGFTLIELIVTITILATLIVGVIIAFNPQRQIEKSKDAVRREDIESIKTALDAYYHDTQCYPTSLSFGSEWSVGAGASKTVYMKQIPQDSTCNTQTGENCYQYKTDTSSCPQWNVVFAQLSADTQIDDACPVTSLSNCAPEGFQSSNWSCAMSGNVQCEGLGGLASSSLLPPTPTPTQGVQQPTSTPTPPPGAGLQGDEGSTPTPTPGESLPATTYYLAMNTDPWLTQAVFAPYPVATGDQTIEVVAKGSAPVKSVVVRAVTDGTTNSYELSLSSGTDQDGVWSGTWKLPSMVSFDYTLYIDVTNGNGTTNTGTITIR